LEYCGHVLSLPPTHFGAVSSSSTAPQQSAQTTTQGADTGKGNEIEQD